MPLGEVFAWTAVVGGLALLGAARWSDAMLGDEARYLRAVRGVPASPLVQRATPIVVARLARRHGVPTRWSRSLGRRTGSLARGRIVGVTWVAAHRRLHRAPRSDWRVTASMLVLAAVGTVASLRQHGGVPRRT